MRYFGSRLTTLDNSTIFLSEIYVADIDLFKARRMASFGHVQKKLHDLYGRANLTEFLEKRGSECQG